jgi:signal transduction histidine kinase
MKNNKRKRHNRVWGFFALLFSYCLAFAAGYAFTSLIYRFTGQPPEIFRHLFSGLSAVIVILIGWRILMKISDGFSHRKEIMDIHDELTGTLAQIAKGNFDVLLDPGNVGVFNELAEAINEMAKNLGTLETMRQDFISNVSHEIQSPLTSIGGFAALLQKEGLPDGERRHYAKIIAAETKRLSSLSENLLKLSSLENNKIPLSKKDFRLDKQLENTALISEPQWSVKNIELEADLQKINICGDEDLLSQAWVNLLHNAIKFTPEGGRIHISLSPLTDGKTAAVKISDTGAGIAPDDQIHIFERFYKADKARDRSLGGNGLGLSLVKRIVEMHGGSITVESEIGKGTVFEIVLPV